MPIVRAATLQDTLHLKEVPANGFAWHDLLQAGLPYRSLTTAAKAFGLKEPALGALLGLVPRSQTARKKAKRLNAAESDLLYAMARAYVRAAAFMGREKAGTWLMSEVEALKGNRPFELLGSRLGTEYVMTLLERLRPAIKQDSSLDVDDSADEDEDA